MSEGSETAPPPATRARRRPLTLSRIKAFVRWHIVGIHTLSGRVMDLVFIAAVVVAIIALSLESVPSVVARYDPVLNGVETVVGSMFVVEYLLRIWVARYKLRYIFSFWGLIDLLAILPFLFRGFGLAYLRMFRVLRIFAILKISRYTRASSVLIHSLLESRTKVAVFLLTVVVLVCVIGFTMHAVEPQTFPTIPDAIWWTIVTITTVGYGDLVPVTLLGKTIAAFTMITAFGIIAVPTGIVAVEYGQAVRDARRTVKCPRCRRDDHEERANYCSTCGEALPEAA